MNLHQLYLGAPLKETHISPKLFSSYPIQFLLYMPSCRKCTTYLLVVHAMKLLRRACRRLVIFDLLGLVELLDGTEGSWTATLGISTSWQSTAVAPRSWWLLQLPPCSVGSFASALHSTFFLVNGLIFHVTRTHQKCLWNLLSVRTRLHSPST